MFKKITHADGVVSENEILFSTPFGYLFPDAARSTPCLLPQTDLTLTGLRALGRAMADTGTVGSPQATLDSPIPAAFTYLGQFIDHDITARTDRDSSITSLGKGAPILPVDPDAVMATLRNGRRPQLDLDSVFGDGPGLVGTTESQMLYDADFKLVVFEEADRVDLMRTKTPGLDGDGNPTLTFLATVGDQRNDENINVSQLHTSFARFYNAVHDDQAGSAKEKYVRARQLARWTYQYVVVHDYLPTVCDQSIVADMLANGPRFYGGTAGQGTATMPLEFSTAGFRFAHSMIRPFYKLSGASGELPLLQVLGTNGNAANFGSQDQLRKALVIDWTNFVGGTAQRARMIDTKIAHDLFTLPLAGRTDDPVLTSLAQSNLFRAYNLSIPTGQAVADAMGVSPLRSAEILTGEDPAIAEAVKDAYFDHRSPLWYYVLREAAVQQGGERLGEVGSRLVCETLLGLLKGDPNSYLNNQHDPAVTPTGIEVTSGVTPIGNLTALLKKGGAFGL